MFTSNNVWRQIDWLQHSTADFTIVSLPLHDCQYSDLLLCRMLLRRMRHRHGFSKDADSDR